MKLMRNVFSLRHLKCKFATPNALSKFPLLQIEIAKLKITISECTLCTF